MAHQRALTDQLTDQDRALLTRVQQHIPLVPEPFAAVAAELGLPEPDLLTRLSALKVSGAIRELSAIFDSRALGYQSTLVAARVPPGDLERAAAAISAHPGVSHNYERDHDFNLWFTLAVPPGTDLAAEVDRLHLVAGAKSIRILPSVRTFKIGVRLEMGGADAAERDDAPAGSATGQVGCSEAEARVVRALQQDLPLLSRPFDERAESEGFANSAELLALAERMKAEGKLRRLAAVLRHRLVGFGENAMVVWEAPAGETERLGRLMASFARVSHCYERPVYPDWPYNLFTMIHGRQRCEIDGCVAAMEREVGPISHRVIYSLREFKKERVRYFTA